MKEGSPISSYNLLQVSLRCPRCGEVGITLVDFRFGLLELREYALGERLEWGERGDRWPKERPEEGNFSGEGYAECSFCEKDYWVRVEVRADVLAEVVIDSSKSGYIP